MYITTRRRKSRNAIASGYKVYYEDYDHGTSAARLARVVNAMDSRLPLVRVHSRPEGHTEQPSKVRQFTLAQLRGNFAFFLAGQRVH